MVGDVGIVMKSVMVFRIAGENENVNFVSGVEKLMLLGILVAIVQKTFL